jgi:hypothetical protein
MGEGTDRLLTHSPKGHEPGKPEPQAGVDPATVIDPAQIEHDVRATTRIVLRPIGSPLPLGFFTVAIDNVVVSALQWGLLPAADRRAVALIVLPAFIVQAIVGVFALGARDSIAGTLMLSFATTWLVDALVFYLDPPGAAASPGIFYIVFAVFVLFMLVSALLSVPWPPSYWSPRRGSSSRASPNSPAIEHSPRPAPR